MLFIFREVGAVVLTGCSLPTVSIRATAGTVHTASFENKSFQNHLTNVQYIKTYFWTEKFCQRINPFE